MIKLDRIENGIAVIEDENGDFTEIPLSELPDGVREGSALTRTDCGFEAQKEETRKLRKRNSVRANALFKRK